MVIFDPLSEGSAQLARSRRAVQRRFGMTPDTSHFFDNMVPVTAHCGGEMGRCLERPVRRWRVSVQVDKYQPPQLVDHFVCEKHLHQIVSGQGLTNSEIAV